MTTSKVKTKQNKVTKAHLVQFFSLRGKKQSMERQKINKVEIKD